MGFNVLKSNFGLNFKIYNSHRHIALFHSIKSHHDNTSKNHIKNNQKRHQLPMKMATNHVFCERIVIILSHPTPKTRDRPPNATTQSADTKITASNRVARKNADEMRDRKGQAPLRSSILEKLFHSHSQSLDYRNEIQVFVYIKFYCLGKTNDSFDITLAS